MENKKANWWREARFGVFFHWGIYSALERGEWAYYLEKIPYDEYKKLAGDFRPKKDWADNWVRLIKDSGAKFAVLTTKHCDGYCLFDTRTSSDYSAPTTAPGRDLVAEYIEACRKHNIKVGLYYTPLDWRYYWKEDKGMRIPAGDTPKYREYSEIVLTHIEELCNNYGPIDYWWWDGSPPEVEKTIADMRRWQPSLLINDRCGLRLGIGSGEKKHYTPPYPGYDWELSQTSNDHWGYYREDHCWLTVTKSIHWMVSAASHNGSFLYNIGPKADGDIPAQAQDIFNGMGRWLSKYGNSYYGTTSSHVEGGCSGCTTAKGNVCYLHIHHYTYPYYVVISPKADILSATIMADGKKLSVKQDGRRFILTGLPEKPPDAHDTVIVLQTDRDAQIQEETPEDMPAFIKHYQDILYGK